MSDKDISYSHQIAQLRANFPEATIEETGKYLSTARVHTKHLNQLVKKAFELDLWPWLDTIERDGNYFTIEIAR